jgi:hypothetical protein
MLVADKLVHVPLRVPGWRGLIAVALLVGARRLAGRPRGATWAALTAALACLAAGDAGRFGPLAYVLPGVALDLLLLWRSRPSVGYVVFAGGLANASRLALMLAFPMAGGMAGMGGRAGLYPFVTHFAFGACGSLIAFAITVPRKGN